MYSRVFLNKTYYCKNKHYHVKTCVGKYSNYILNTYHKKKNTYSEWFLSNFFLFAKKYFFFSTRKIVLNS